jgi:hypothetical protein
VRPQTDVDFGFDHRSSFFLPEISEIEQNRLKRPNDQVSRVLAHQNVYIRLSWHSLGSNKTPWKQGYVEISLMKISQKKQDVFSFRYAE